MGVHENHLGLFPHLRDRGVQCIERILQNRLHESARLHIDDAHLSLCRFENNGAVSRRARRIIDRTQQTRFGVDKWKDILLIPNVIARRYHGDACAQKIDRDLRGNPAPTCRVLSVHDDEIGAMLFL